MKPKECDGGEGDHFYSGGGGRGDCGGSGGGHFCFTCGQPDHLAVHLVETCGDGCYSSHDFSIHLSS